MTPQRILVGRGRHPVVIVDDATGDRAGAVALAAAMAPFPAGPNPHYPGLRRVIDKRDTAACGYVDRLLQGVAPFIAGGFDCDGFDLIEASFSIVTTPATALTPAQRAPHFDATDPDHLAVLHYLSDHPASGTAFYRQRSTGIEAVTPASIDRFVGTVRAGRTTATGYINASTDAFEQIAMVEGKPDRLVIYQGRLLHSGIIPVDLPLDPDPRVGRLTANLFVQIRR